MYSFMRKRFSNTGGYTNRVDLWDHMTFSNAWSDHDFMSNNSDKICNCLSGDTCDTGVAPNAGKWSASNCATAKANSVAGWLHYIPAVDAPSENTNYQYGLWRTFTLGGNVCVYFLDERFNRDPDNDSTGIFGGDMLDGCRPMLQVILMLPM